MSSDPVGTTLPLRRTDPGYVSKQVRKQLQVGGVSMVVIDMENAELYTERSQEAQTAVDLDVESKEALGETVDPVDVIMGEDLIELRVTAQTLRGAMFDAAHTAGLSGAHVIFWACGDIQEVARLGDFKLPLIKNEPMVVLGALVQESDRLNAGDLVACLSSVPDALPVEVESGLLIRLEDLISETGSTSSNRGRVSTEGGASPDGGQRPDGGRVSAPAWFGPAPN
tara:strand:- start:375 stop:1052 length:678 start_codon:yes stop_codon:yes gene_type:complete